MQGRADQRITLSRQLAWAPNGRGVRALDVEMVVSKVWGSCRLGRVMGDGEAVERKREKRSSNWEQKVLARTSALVLGSGIARYDGSFSFLSGSLPCLLPLTWCDRFTSQSLIDVLPYAHRPRVSDTNCDVCSPPSSRGICTLVRDVAAGLGDCLS